MKQIGILLALIFSLALSAQNNSFTYLALGDSYTIGTAIGKKNAYPGLLVDSIVESFPELKVSTEVIAKNGWTTRDLLNGIASENPEGTYDMVSLLIGVNNQYQGLSKKDYRNEFIGLLEKSIGLAGGIKENVFVISIPDYGVCTVAVDDLESISPEIDAFNAINKSIADSIGVSYIYITEISRIAKGKEELIASDGLHFSSAMHELWVKKIWEDYVDERLRAWL